MSLGQALAEAKRLKALADKEKGTLSGTVTPAKSNTSETKGGSIAASLAANLLKAVQPELKVAAKNLPKEVLKTRKHTTLHFVKDEDFVDSVDTGVRAKAFARYLYWACFRGDNRVVEYLIGKVGISPFYPIYEGKSPLMASLQGKNRPI